MLYEALIYILLYHIDMFSAIVFCKTKPNLFDVAESNQQLKNLLKRFTIPQAVWRYTLFIGIEYFLIIVFAIFLTYRVIFGAWDIVSSLSFSFVFMSFVHFFGLLTNLASLMKKEIEVKK